MNEDGHTSSIRDKILTITVKKGWKPNTRITFPEEGDQGPNNVPGKTLFHVLELHVLGSTEGNNFGDILFSLHQNMLNCLCIANCNVYLQQWFGVF